MRRPGGLLRLLPLAGGSIHRSPACSSQHTWTTCLAAGVSHSLLQQSPACVHSVLHPFTQPLPAISLQSFRPQRQFFSLPGSSPDLSKHYKERRLIGYSPEQLYDVVSKVENYKDFVPWCERSTVLERRDDSYMEAELEVGFKVFVERYTSKITLEKNKLVLTKVADSTLFNSLDNRWEFAPGPTPGSCWLSFSVDFAFKSPLYGQLATVFFKEVVQRMMGAFEGQCRRQFGPSTFNAPQHTQKRAASA